MNFSRLILYLGVAAVSRILLDPSAKPHDLSLTAILKTNEDSTKRILEKARNGRLVSLNISPNKKCVFGWAPFRFLNQTLLTLAEEKEIQDYRQRLRELYDSMKTEYKIEYVQLNFNGFEIVPFVYSKDVCPYYDPPPIAQDEKQALAPRQLLLDANRKAKAQIELAGYLEKRKQLKELDDQLISLISGAQSDLL